jgi:hypothetical protein
MGSFARIGALITFLGMAILAGSLMLTGVLEVNDKIDDVVLEVDYFEHWNMTFSHGGVAESWSGMGRREKLLVRPSTDAWVISVQAEKVDASSGQLKVRIRSPDGMVLKQAATILPYGKITLVVEIQ